MVNSNFHSSEKYDVLFSTPVNNLLNRGQSDIMVKNNRLLEKYHTNEQNLNKIIIYNIIVMLWVGMFLIVFSTICTVLQDTDPNIITLVSGAIIEIVSGTLLILAKHEINSRDRFFDTLSKSEELRRLALIINSIPDENLRAQCMKEYIGYIIK